MESQFKLLQRCRPGPPPSLDDYNLKYLAKGSFGKVYQAVHRSTNKLCALKEISKFNGKVAKQNRQLQYINQQLRIMYALDCEYIVRIYDHFESASSIYLVLQLVEGVELYAGIIQRRMTLSGKVCARIIHQLCQALKHMHSRNIIHRDIKPENILLTKQLNIKLIDFGTANYCGPQHNRSTKIGSLPYFAPEIVQKRSHDQAVDVWCVGILLYEMNAFRTPFEHESNTELNILVRNKTTKNKKIDYPDEMPADLRDLIGKILIRDAKGRLTLEQIMEHPWVVRNLPKGYHEVQGLLRQPPPSPATKTIQPSTSAVAVVPKLQLKKNALITEQTKPKDWSSSGKFLIKKEQPLPASSKSKGKSVGKRISPSRLMQAQVKTLQKQLQALEDSEQRAIKKLRTQQEKKIRDFQLKIQRVQKQKNKRQSIIQSNSLKLLKLKKDIQASIAQKQQNEQVQRQIGRAEEQLERLKEDRKLLMLKEQAIEMEIKQLKKQLSSAISKPMSTTSSFSRNKQHSKSSNRLKSSSKNLPSLRLKTSAGLHNKTVSDFSLVCSKQTGRTQGSITVGEIDQYIEQMREKRHQPTTISNARHS